MIIIVLPDIAEEDRLLDRARQGDPEALRAIYQSYFAPIFNFIRLRVDDIYEAEDLASEVFVKMLEAFKNRRTAPRHSLRAWLFRVARNALYDRYGRERPFTEIALTDWLPASIDSDAEALAIRSMAAEDARLAVRQLSSDQQEVIVLRFAQMLSLQETADIMGKSLNAVKQLQFRAVNALRRTLSAYEAGG
jgi:RNA polymerase sigma-70 factor (ECF subfamily)